MEDILNFHFIRPYFLLLLLPLFFWKFIKILAGNKVNIWRKAIDEGLLSHMFQKQNLKKNKINQNIIIAIWVLLAISLCGPAWKEVPKAMYKNLAPTIILLDTSTSMDTDDIAPTRLLRSVLKIYDILRLKKGGLFSLVVYSDEPYVVVPLSDDIQVIETYLPMISSSIMPSNGTRLDRAIELAVHELKKSGLKAAHIVAFSDSASHYKDYDDVLGAANDAADDGYIVSVFGVGSLDASSIKTEDGKIITNNLNEESFVDVVKFGRGRYHQITNDDTDINYIFEGIEKRLRELNPLVKTNLDSTMWEDEGILFLIPVLFLFPFLFRKGVVSIIVIGIVSSCLSSPVFAKDLREMFLSPEQYGRLLLNERKFHQAEEYLSTNTQLLAISMIHSGKARKLLPIIAKEQDFETLYNVGTLLAFKEEYMFSQAVLEKAVKANPNSYEANYNLAVVNEIVKKIKSNPGGDGQGQEGENKGGDDDSKEDKSDEENQDENSTNQQQDDLSGIDGGVDDIAEILRNKLYRIYMMKRYGSGGEEIQW